MSAGWNFCCQKVPPKLLIMYFYSVNLMYSYINAIIMSTFIDDEVLQNTFTHIKCPEQLPVHTMLNILKDHVYPSEIVYLLSCLLGCLFSCWFLWCLLCCWFLWCLLGRLCLLGRHCLLGMAKNINRTGMSLDGGSPRRTVEMNDQMDPVDISNDTLPKSILPSNLGLLPRGQSQHPATGGLP